MGQSDVAPRDEIDTSRPKPEKEKKAKKSKKEDKNLDVDGDVDMENQTSSNNQNTTSSSAAPAKKAKKIKKTKKHHKADNSDAPTDSDSDRAIERNIDSALSAHPGSKRSEWITTAEWNKKCDVFVENNPGKDFVESRDYLNPRRRRNLTSPYLTKYEKTRVLAARVNQITLNSKILIDPKLYQLNASSLEGCDPERIAELELEQGKIPFIIRRYLPAVKPGSGGQERDYEDWRVCDLLDPDNW
ncbi:unnamed protein product [Amoebophrya sp. A120]|nr:unnamed protein product [Amoebophrya sp. A120]|eukprot:GSA120T00015557001.1